MLVAMTDGSAMDARLTDDEQQLGAGHRKGQWWGIRYGIYVSRAIISIDLQVSYGRIWALGGNSQQPHA